MRRGEAKRQGAPLSSIKIIICKIFKSVVQFRLKEYLKELGHFHKSLYNVAGRDSSLEVDSVKPWIYYINSKSYVDVGKLRVVV